jgi:lysozyme family protein
MRGVIQRVYDGYRERKGQARQTVRLITEDELRDIYRGNYWRLVSADQLPAGLDLAVFDFGVNSGPARAVRYLQACLGVVQDGHMGPATVQAANRADAAEMVAALCNARRKFVRQIRTYPVFGKGWERRIMGVEAVALAMARQAPAEKPAPQPLPEADAQSAEQARATEEAKPASNAAVGTIAVTAGGAAVGAVQSITAPPPALTDSVTNIGLWQSIGRQCAEFGRFVLSNPIEVGIVAFFVAAVWFGPRLLPYIWSREA